MPQVWQVHHKILSQINKLITWNICIFLITNHISVKFEGTRGRNLNIYSCVYLSNRELAYKIQGLWIDPQPRKIKRFRRRVLFYVSTEKLSPDYIPPNVPT